MSQSVLIVDDDTDMLALEEGALAAKGYRVALDTMTVGTHAGLRYAVGDPDWRGWTQLPSATIVGQ